MDLPRRPVAFAVVACLFSLASLSAQQVAQLPPRVGYVYPAGGQQGAACQVTIGGQYLDRDARVHVTGDGLQAQVTDYVKPLTQQQFNDLRERLMELMKERKDAEAWQEIAELRKKLATFVRNTNPTIAETLTVELTLAPDAEPGAREIRVETSLGLSNPRAFWVGRVSEFTRPPAHKVNEPTTVREFRARFEPRAVGPRPEMSITLPASVNGQLLPGGVDRYRFSARQGQQVVAAVRARDLIPYLPDAVPGWVQATLAIFDAQGKELAYADDYRFQPDPVLRFEIPTDGEYVLEIKDAIYRGREDFVYRITVGELPFVTSIFPLGGPAGTATRVELTGWNLPFSRLTQDTQAQGPGIYPLAWPQAPAAINRLPFQVDTLPECLEHEPNNSREQAQTVSVPVIVNGRIDQADDWDVFRFDGRAGTTLVAEVSARRLESPLDSVLKLTDARGQQLAVNDDHDDPGAGLTTHQADSWLSVTLPADGTYYLHLGDTQHKGGAAYAYRLRISPARPDFELRIVPSAINARVGATVPLTVSALRKDGFSGEIALALKDAAEGFALSGARIPARQDQVRLTLTVPALPQDRPHRLCLEGRAQIDGRELLHTAVPADSLMQAFAYRHLVPAQELQVAVAGRNPARVPVRIRSELPVRIPAGGTARVQIAVPRTPFLPQIHLDLSEPPDGLTLQSTAAVRDGFDLVLQSDGDKVQAGQQGNLIVVASAERPNPSGKPLPPLAQRRFPVATLPAIPFEIVGR